ncbi:MAG TPA: tripartite tricarboxylate transporter substrate binding protein [Caldimonas sp.]|jgi:tripartite-type tricarboxylate transporter receptor subunit TctC|nr:tripartite tricarboxylate transporter substrate binding protein [Caldimonas sp.]HEX2541456.1 tripartite tricarboxylate transporter substrate binding protein [Caldimonas sp.]
MPRSITRRDALGRACLLAAALACAGSLAQAQDYPSKPISIVVPFPPGGTTDLVTRTLAEALSKSLGQPVLVENRPGAGTTVGADVVAKARPDGYTLLMGAVHHTIAPSVYKKLSYDLQKDLVPITTVASVPNIVAVNPTVTPVKSIAELIALAKASAQKPLSYGSNGNGTAQHLIGTLFQQQTGTTLLHVPYKGSAPLVADLLAGQVNMSFDSITAQWAFLKNGKLLPLAVTAQTRSSFLPNVPTLQEAGLKGFDIQTWYGVMAPAGTPRPVIERLNAEMVKIIKSPAFASAMANGGCEPLGSTPAEMSALISSEMAKFAQIVKDGNLVVE